MYGGPLVFKDRKSIPKTKSAKTFLKDVAVTQQEF